MSSVIYPGTFNPWHVGHQDVLDKALRVFSHVTIARGINVLKLSAQLEEKWEHNQEIIKSSYGSLIEITSFKGLLVDEVKKHRYKAVIRGLRNTQDLQYEIIQQYWNEDLGLHIPTVFFVSDRSLVHISSSAIRTVEASR